ncbi:hypothetical protein BJ138DRAFT_1146664 [Hygrophoropsis aurantiaca]|uniref:Uncharacterized protein n=1 Tax=Hygrophoropsis aurantiaca TaxID=72124 RepID=A0ACB8AKP7_9AGAM|nr:hypothetical protein BJ138DRAFT_1146664 [Hygrophoropsis aurantiaca]
MTLSAWNQLSRPILTVRLIRIGTCFSGLCLIMLRSAHHHLHHDSCKRLLTGHCCDERKICERCERPFRKISSGIKLNHAVMRTIKHCMSNQFIRGN